MLMPKAKPSKSKTPKKRSLKTAKRPFPVWKGPEIDGITQSMIGKWMTCRERARLEWVEGLKPIQEFNHKIEYGNMWHECEEAYANSGNPIVNNPKYQSPWLKRLTTYCEGLVKKYPAQQSQIDHWYRVCMVQFPLYIDHWKRHKDIVNRTSLWEEKVFAVPYQLPDGREVLLRGKFDSVDYVKRGRKTEIWLQENKAKGDIDEQSIIQQLDFDRQNGMYLTALDQISKGHEIIPISETEAIRKGEVVGVRYNVIRRPLSGGKGTIRRHKATKTKPEETVDHFYNVRVKEIIQEDPEYFFFRPAAEYSHRDLLRYQREFLNPLLMDICNWWDWVGTEKGIRQPFEHPQGLHYRTPYGNYSPIQHGRGTDLDYYLKTGNSTGLQRIDKLFEEL